MKSTIKKIISIIICSCFMFACTEQKLVLEVGEIDESATNSLFVYENDLSNKSIDEIMNTDYPLLIGADLEDVNLTKYVDNLYDSKFNTKTKWPEKMPAEFDPNLILEKAKQPGLNIDKIHEQNITGKNVGVALIDGPLLTQHIEYKHALKSYKIAHSNNDEDVILASNHGAAVISILAGKNVGVAPDSDVYYIADQGFRVDATPKEVTDALIDDVNAIIELNKKLPKDKKIRIVGITYGKITEDLPNYNEWKNVIKKANEDQIFILDIQALHEYFGLGLRLKPGYDANDLNSYIPLSFATSETSLKRLYGYVQGKTYASPTGEEDYTYDAQGGSSWFVPYVCGLYALACQVDNDLSFDEFHEILLETSVRYECIYEERYYNIEKVIQPEAMIERVKEKVDEEN